MAQHNHNRGLHSHVVLPMAAPGITGIPCPAFNPHRIAPMRCLRCLFACSLLMTAFTAERDPKSALEALRATVPQVHITIDPHLGVARHIASPAGFLTGPAGIGKAVAQAAQAGDDRAVRGFLTAWPALFGGGAEILDDAELVRDDITAHSGLRTRTWQQRLDGIPVHRGLLVARTTSRDELVAIGSGFAPRLPQTAAQLAERAKASATPRAAPPHSAAAALAAALRERGLSEEGIAQIELVADPLQTQRLRANAALGEITAHLTWFASADGLNLAWSFTVVEKPQSLMYVVVVDTTSLKVLERIRLTSEYVATPEQMRKAMAEGARADHPTTHAGTSSTTTTRMNTRGLPNHRFTSLGGGCACHSATSPAMHPTGNPSSGATPSLATALAMRVYTSDSPTPMTPGFGSPTSTQPPEVARTLVELTSIDATASPDGWIDANNETRGNNAFAHLDLDANNIADLPRPSGTGTPVTFDFALDLTQAPSTYRSAAVVNLFYWCNVAHDRLYQLGFSETAGNFQQDNFGRGGSGNDAVQADAQDGSDTDNANFSTPADGSAPRMQMFVFTGPNPDRDSSLDATVVLHEYVHGLTNRLVGGGAVGSLNTIQSAGMGEGWSDFYALALLSEPGDDPLGTYAVGSYVTRNYFRGIRSNPYAVEPASVVSSSSLNPQTFNDIIGDDSVHSIGEVWCQTLWECRGEMINKHGDAAGNTLMLELVTDGLKLTPANPTFTQARDAILQADLVNTGGANQIELWRAFAKRGLGFGASAGADSTSTTVTESFEASQRLRVSNAAGVFASGEPGGPFTVTGSFSLHNPGSTSVAWTASKNRSWLNLSATSGNLAGGATSNLTITLTVDANALPEGVYADSVAVTDTGTGVTVVRPVTLVIRENYTVTADTFAWVDPSAHTNLSLSDDAVSSAQAIGFTFPFYGSDRTQIRVSSNGMIGFGASEGLTEVTNTALPSTGAPNDMLAVWWDDLNPAAGGSVRIGSDGSAPNRRLIVSWVGVPHFSANPVNTYTFQALLEEATGDLVVQYQEVRPAQATFGAGRSATIGVEHADGLTARQFSHNGSTLLSNSLALRFHIAASTPPANATPTVATPAAVGPLNGAGTTRTVTVLGADSDGGGEADLVYAWSLAGSPTTLFSIATNGSNAAKNSTATFTAAGTYELRATITDGGGKSVTSSVTTTIPQQLTTMVITPASTSVTNGDTVDFTAVGSDQFGNTITAEPTVTWSKLSGPGSINSSTGLYTANGQGSATIQAQNGAITATATITITNSGPTVATAAAATPSPVTGISTAVSVVGSDDLVESALTYTWSTTGTPPAAVSFSPNGTNAAKNSTATFAKAGAHTLRVTISDASAASVTSDVTVTVQQTATGLAIDPSTATVAPSAARTFTARDGDQFGDPIAATTRTVTWATTLGTISAAGEFTAPTATGTATITATATVGGQSDTATVTIATGGGGGGGGGSGGGCGLGATSALALMLLLVTWRRRRLGD